MAKSKYQKDFPKEVQRMAEKGMTEKQIAKCLGISQQTFEDYKKQYPLFIESLKKGKRRPDEDVISALFMRAVGYSHPDVHISSYQGEVKITSIIKHYPPDTTAIIFWLCNRLSDKWRSVNKDGVSNDNNWTTQMKIEGLDGSVI